MIEYIKGSISELTPTTATIETSAGIGYLLNITLGTYSELETAPGEIRMLVHEIIREDAWVLYGFTTLRDRELFRRLIGVSGVGANTARMIMSAYNTTELELIITSGSDSRLKAVKGVGAKTAERIIVDLKDKIKPGDDTLSLQPAMNTEAYEEALAALVMLGFPKPQSQKVLKKLYDQEPALAVEAAIKRAFTMM